MDTLTCVFQTYHPDFPEVYSYLLHTYNSSRRSVIVVVLGGRVAYYPHPKHPKGRKRCDTEEEKVTMAPRRRHDTPVAPPNPISTIILRSKVKLIKPMKKHRSESQSSAKRRLDLESPSRNQILGAFSEVSSLCIILGIFWFQRRWSPDSNDSRTKVKTRHAASVCVTLLHCGTLRLWSRLL